VVTAVLANPQPHIGNTYHLTGPESENMHFFAQEYSNALGRRIMYEDIPVELWRDGLLQRSLPIHLVNHLTTMADLHRAGRYDRMSNDVLTLTEQAPMSMQEFVRRHGKGDSMAATGIAIRTMKVAQIAGPGAEFEVVEREVPEPGPGQVRIKVQACGICHSDALTKDGHLPGIEYPRIPGHEVAGFVDALSDSGCGWNLGQRVGVGWHGGRDGTCAWCRRGDFRNCRNLKIPGISYDGGYQEYMVVPVDALVAVPDSFDAAEAAPLLCAGLTTFNSLRHSGALPGDLVAVQGVGGLGHLAIQYASKGEYLHRQQCDERSQRVAEDGRRTGNPDDGP
jgi:hypothetical protein